MVEEKKEDLRKIFIVLKRDSVLEEENKKLIKDLTMFADKTLDLG